VETIWSWSGERLPETEWVSEGVLTGIGSAGPGFNQNQWRELAFLINLMLAFRALDQAERERLTADGWAFV
jgi:5-methylcytosine-specific restriction protein B